MDMMLMDLSPHTGEFQVIMIIIIFLSSSFLRVVLSLSSKTLI